MMLPPAAEALFDALEKRVSGTLELVAAQGQRASVSLLQGDVVGGRVGFGFQSLSQVLLREGKLTLAQFDALWSSGEGGELDESSLFRLGLDEKSADQIRWRVQLRELVSRAMGFQFVAAPIPEAPVKLPGTQAIRAACEAATPSLAGRRIRVKDPLACAAWVSSPEEGQYLERLRSFVSGVDIAPSHRALMVVLLRAGLAESMTEAEFNARNVPDLPVAPAIPAPAAPARPSKPSSQPMEIDPSRMMTPPAVRRLETVPEMPVVGASPNASAQAPAASVPSIWGTPAAGMQLGDDELNTDSWQTDNTVVTIGSLGTGLSESQLDALQPEAELTFSADPETGFTAAEPLAPVPLVPAAYSPEAELAPPPAASVHVAPELADASWAEMLETPAPRPPEVQAERVLETPAPAVPEIQMEAVETATPAMPEIQMEAMETPTPAMPEVQIADLLETPVSVVPEIQVAGERDTVEARQRAQAQLIQEMNEALRRAGASSDEQWMADEPTQAATPTAAVPSSSPAEEPSALVELDLADVDDEPTLTAETLVASMEGEELGPDLTPPTDPPISVGDTPSPVDANLWNILQFGDAEDTSIGSGFERAFEAVDAKLEELVGKLPSVSEAADDSFEVTFEPSGDNPVGTVQTSRTEVGGDDWSDFSDGEEDELAGDPSDPAEAARLRRKRLMRRAMENLGAFAQTPAPTSTTTGAVEVQQMPTPSPPAEAPAPPPAAPGAQGTPDEQQLAALIEKRYAEIKGGVDRFAVLGIPRDGSKDSVKGAFLNLAKIFHPDRLPASLVSLAPKMTSIFEAIRESYEMLYDDTKRKAYIHALDVKAAQAAVAASNAPTDNAEDAFRRAEALFRKRDFVAAEEQYARAHELKPSAVNLAGRAWAIYMDPSRKAEMPKAKQMMVEALRLNPRCDRAHYQLGVVARVEGEMDRAEKHFRDAVEANPKHLEAAQELRLFEMRRKNSGKKGLFK